MIVDTSALIAILRQEDAFLTILQALLAEPSTLPTPALVEFWRVSAVSENRPHPEARPLLTQLLGGKLRIEPLMPADAEHASTANELYGTGNGRGGTLNLLDLMVYGMAKRMDRPILCTGRDFAATDIVIHPASRPW